MKLISPNRRMPFGFILHVSVSADPLYYRDAFTILLLMLIGSDGGLIT
ncbi:MAG: hypothetical protein LBK58_14095 [Prevotellaceae bacterium]|nr:hypothetical protein [Prevotellaceae bacterium]